MTSWCNDASSRLHRRELRRVARVAWLGGGRYVTKMQMLTIHLSRISSRSSAAPGEYLSHSRRSTWMTRTNRRKIRVSNQWSLDVISTVVYPVRLLCFNHSVPMRVFRHPGV